MLIGEKNFYIKIEPEKILNGIVEYYLSVIRLYPEIKTENRYKKIKLPVMEHRQKQIEKLLEMLTHANTVINRIRREKTKEGLYISEREDYINALMMISPLIELYKKERKKTEEAIIEEIKIHIKKGELFSRRDIEMILGYSHTHTHRIIRYLEEREMIEKVGGYKNRGYKYILTHSSDAQSR